MRRVLATDPGGCWVTEDAAGLTGAVLALLREGLWGLSLLVVRPDLQSTGIGSALLARALEYGAGARGGVILASPDARALRAYARAGFELHPTVVRHGQAARRRRRAGGARVRAGRSRAGRRGRPRGARGGARRRPRRARRRRQRAAHVPGTRLRGAPRGCGEDPRRVRRRGRGRPAAHRARARAGRHGRGGGVADRRAAVGDRRGGRGAARAAHGRRGLPARRGRDVPSLPARRRPTCRVQPR